MRTTFVFAAKKISNIHLNINASQATAIRDGYERLTTNIFEAQI